MSIGWQFILVSPHLSLFLLGGGAGAASMYSLSYDFLSIASRVFFVADRSRGDMGLRGLGVRTESTYSVSHYVLSMSSDFFWSRSESWDKAGNSY